MRKRPSLLLITALGAVLVLSTSVASWGQSGDMGGRPKPIKQGPAARPAPPAPSPLVADPSVSGPSKDIQQIDLEGLKKLLARDGKDTRPMLVNFWATWCDPCREEFPDLVKLDEDYRGKNFNFVTVSLDDVSDLRTEVPKFLKEMKATMPTVLLNVNDPAPAIKAVDAVWDGQLPATFLYDKDGKVVFRHFGRIKPDELRAAVEKEVSRKQ